MSKRLFSFIGGSIGSWRVISTHALVGEQLPIVDRFDIVDGADAAAVPGTRWHLRGTTSNARYVARTEQDELNARQPPLARVEAAYGAFIPVRKTAAWWVLAQDQRRRIFEESSHHVRVGLGYLPKIARRLHHCRDLASAEPFDFLTWFEFAPADTGAFDEMLATLRATEEWEYVDREIDIRAVLDAGSA